MARMLFRYALGVVALGLVGCRHCETVVTVYYSNGRDRDRLYPGGLSVLGVIVAVCVWILMGGLGPTRQRKDPDMQELEERIFEGERLEALRRLQVDRRGR